jgi:L,D-peptidoglycan transpeptidase YkuD (ErfK/YbiS/YcfS/YnhG family)
VTRAATVAVLLALAASGCNEKKPASTASSPAAAALPLPQTPPAAQALIPSTTTQLVTAITDSWTSTHATLQLWTRTDGGAWTARAAAPWPAVLGRAGTAWGVGLHGAGAPAGRNGTVKTEGDGKSPAGMFAIRNAYGYADEPPKDTKLDYTSTGRGDLECVDDPASEHYASIVDRKQVASDWESAEQMMRDDALYTWVVDVAHNPERKPRAGSCIFLHVWGGPETTTSGCTAMQVANLEELLRTLDPASKPVYVLLPRAEYEALAVAWGLPAQ